MMQLDSIDHETLPRLVFSNLSIFEVRERGDCQV